MKANLLKSLFTVFLFLAISPLCHAQYAYRVIPRTADPATCSPGNGSIYYNTTSNALRICIAANTWGNAGQAGTSIVNAQGTLTAASLAINTTATWNNAAVTFTHWFANVTDTASAAASLLLDLQVGGVSQFNVTKAGAVTATGVITGSGFTAAAAGEINWTGRTALLSTADGVLAAANDAGTGFTRMTFGPSSIAGTALVPDIVGGQTQGLILANGDGTTVSFAELGAATNGAIIYCDDCTKATPCAGAGTGALAKRYNGAWDCD